MTIPFSRQIEPSTLYDSKGHREALARLHLMVENRHLGVLTGEVGSGKSLLIRRLFQDLDNKLHLPVYISRTRLRPQDFYSENLICTQALYDAAQRGHDVLEESHIIRILADLDRQRGVTG